MTIISIKDPFENMDNEEIKNLLGISVVLQCIKTKLNISTSSVSDLFLSTENLDVLKSELKKELMIYLIFEKHQDRSYLDVY